MNPQNLPYIVVSAIAVAIAVSVAIYASRQRAAPGGFYVTLLMLAVATWALSTVGEFLAVSVPAKIWWSKITYLGIVGVAPLWLLFVLDYSQRSDWLTPGRIALLWIVPLITIGLVFTNEWHLLIWPRITPASGAPGAMLIYDHGIGFWVNFVYSYSLVLLGTILLVRTAIRSPRLYRNQAKVMLAGAAMPWLGNMLYISGLVPLPGLDLTPVALALTGVTAVVGMLRFQILDLVPVARDTLVERMRDGVIVLDAQNRVVDINPTACRVIGCDAARVIGQQAAVVMAAWPELVARYQDVPEAQAEIELDSPSGVRWLDVRISPLYDRRERLTGRLIVSHDVSARRQAEEVLKQYARELEARNTELDAFAHSVAHDLKSPLSAIIGYSSLLAAGVEKSRDETKAGLRTVLQSAYKMRSIIDNLLLLSSVRRMDDLPSGPVDMAAIVSEVRIRLSAEIAARQAEIDLPQRWPVAVGYAPWVEEVWVNYISNALNYGGDAPRIDLGFDQARDEETEPSIRFWVRDGGPGLTPEEQGRLFSPFTRLEQIDTRGHGLGLSIVGRIVDRLGGQVGVESQVGVGSTFWFTLPTVTPKPTTADS
jgi:PAS domain S-box-containing protein